MTFSSWRKRQIGDLPSLSVVLPPTPGSPALGGSVLGCQIGMQRSSGASSTALPARCYPLLSARADTLSWRRPRENDSMTRSDAAEASATRQRPRLPPRAIRYGEFRVRRSRHSGELLVDRYEVVGLLDQGGMCDVYLAIDTVSDQPVAIKRLRAHLARDPDVRRGFLNEARTSMAATHPNVIKVLGFETPADSQPFIVMEALSGEPLSQHLRRETVMPESMVVRLAVQLASALARAHAVGIVHRDVKPGNLLLVGEQGAPHTVKVIDFGLAHRTSEDAARPTGGNWVAGTAQYMAPEQICADEVDARTDIYAFGVVLFRCVTGHLPFDLEPGADLLGHQLFSPAPPPSWLIDGLDPRLEQVILRCMRKHPGNRYQSMDDVFEDLDAIAATLGAPDDAPLRELPLKSSPDLYKPRNPKGRDAAEILAEQFGTDPPPPPSSRIAAEGLGFKPRATTPSGS